MSGLVPEPQRPVDPLAETMPIPGIERPSRARDAGAVGSPLHAPPPLRTPAERILAEARRLAEERQPPPAPERTLPQFLLLVASVALIFACMMMTTGPMRLLGDVWQRLFYLPVFAAGLLFGFPVSVAVALLAAALSFVHVGWSYGGDFLGMNLVRTIEIVVMVLVGALTGYLSAMVRREKEIAERAQGLLGEACERLLDTGRDLARSLDELSERSVERAALQEQLARADRLASLGTLTAGLAHEVRNPLGAIRGTAEILAGRVGGDPVGAEFAALLLKEADRLNEVLENFLRFVRGSRAPETMSDAAAIARELHALLQPEFARAGVSAELEAPDERVCVALGGASFRQVLLNLLLNATQALGEHDGPRRLRVAVRALPGAAPSPVAPPCAAAEVVVADSGPGVPEDRREEIFDPFFTTRRGGTGLGLAIAARLVGDARGSIELLPRDATRLGGATFIVTLPAPEAPHHHAGALVPGERARD